MATKVLLTGGAGFVGSALAERFRDDGAVVTVVDNLRRRGSERNRSRLETMGIRFHHGDVRMKADLDAIEGTFDVVIDCAAEPSVHASDVDYVVHANLVGTANTLEFVRRRGGGIVFLSTSRVYSLAPLRDLTLVEGATRLELGAKQAFTGVTEHGISEEFPTHLARSLYGASKLASELLVQEYAHQFDVPSVINRCGVIAGPGQFGKVDQGVFTLWVAHHHFGLPLRYTGFGGTGKQVRDLLHPSDLFALLKKQIASLKKCRADIFNVGGGAANAVSLREMTDLCRNATGSKVAVAAKKDTAAVDIPWFVTDSRRTGARFRWAPAIRPAAIVEEIHLWLRENEPALRELFQERKSA